LNLSFIFLPHQFRSARFFILVQIEPESMDVQSGRAEIGLYRRISYLAIELWYTFIR